MSGFDIGGYHIGLDSINPFNTSSNGMFGTLIGGANKGLNDFTGVTAANLSAEAAKENTEKQLAWERERATHAHQWEMQDLEAAGLNPILSAGGSGAVTGGISPQMPDYSGYKGLGGIIDLIQEFITAKTKISEGRKNSSEANLNSARTTTENSIQTLNKALSGKITAEQAGREIENEILTNKKEMSEIDKNWYLTEKWVNNFGKPILDTAEKLFQFKMFKDAIKNSKKNTGFKQEVYNKKTGEIKPKWHKSENGKWIKLEGNWTDLF